MKKVVSIICAAAMLLSFTVGAYASDLDFLTKEYKSFEAKIEFYAELNKPLECLGELNEEAGINVRYLAEELAKTKITADIKAELSEDYLEGKLYVDMKTNLPINFSEDLKVGVDYTYRLWVDYSFKDEENPKLIAIVNNPLNGKYKYMDFFDETFSEMEDVKEVQSTLIKTFKSIGMKDSMAEICSLVKKIYENNGTISRTKDGYIQISFTNNSLVDMFVDLIDGLADTNYMKSIAAVAGEDVVMPSIDNMEADTVKATVKNLGIFADTDAYTMKIKLDNKGYIKESEEKIHLQFNICSLAEALAGITEEDMAPLTKENSDIDITVTGKGVFNKVNEKVEIALPALTEENSTNLATEIFGEYQYDNDYTEEYQPETFDNIATGTVENGLFFVNINRFLVSTKWDSDHLAGNVTLDENNYVTVNLSSDYMENVKIEGDLNSDTYKINGAEVQGKAFTVIETDVWSIGAPNKAVCMNVEILNKLIDSKVRKMAITYMDYFGDTTYEVPQYSFYFVRPNKGYTEPVAELEAEVEADY